MQRETLRRQRPVLQHRTSTVITTAVMLCLGNTVPVNLQAYIILCITTLIWGGNTVAGKMAVGHVSPMMLTGLRWVIACTVLLIFAAPQVRRDFPVIRRNWLLLLGYGTVGFTAFNAFLYSALQYTSAINAVIEQAGIPMVIFVMNYVLFRTAFSLAQIAGFTLTLGGVALTASHGDLTTLLSLDLNQGDAMMMAAVLVYAGYTVALRFKPENHWKSLIAISALGALISSIPLVIWEFSTGRMIWPDMAGLGHRRLCRPPALARLANPLRARRRTDRPQPGRPVHQHDPDLRHATVDHPDRRGAADISYCRHGTRSGRDRRGRARPSAACENTLAKFSPASVRSI